jgi:hypothetical protein
MVVASRTLRLMFVQMFPFKEGVRDERTGPAETEDYQDYVSAALLSLQCVSI